MSGNSLRRLLAAALLLAAVGSCHAGCALRPEVPLTTREVAEYAARSPALVAGGEWPGDWNPKRGTRTVWDFRSNFLAFLLPALLTVGAVRVLAGEKPKPTQKPEEESPS